MLGATLTATALLCVWTVRPLAPPPGRAWLVALDVGQGDALALGFADGWWLVDAGPRTPGYDAGEGVVLPFLRWAGVRRLDWLILTHEDSDHAGGAGAVRGCVRVGRVGISPRHRRDDAAAGGEARALAAGDVLRRSPPARVLWPPRDAAPADDNAAALVLEAGEGAGRVLLAADVDTTAEVQPRPPGRVVVL